MEVYSQVWCRRKLLFRVELERTTVNWASLYALASWCYSMPKTILVLRFIKLHSKQPCVGSYRYKTPFLVDNPPTTLEPTNGAAPIVYFAHPLRVLVHWCSLKDTSYFLWKNWLPENNHRIWLRISWIKVPHSTWYDARVTIGFTRSTHWNTIITLHTS